MMQTLNKLKIEMDRITITIRNFNISLLKPSRDQPDKR